MILEGVGRWAASLATSGPYLTAITARAMVDRSGAAKMMNDWCTLQHRIFGLELSVEDHNDHYDDPPYLFVHLNQTSLIETLLFPVLGRPMRMIVNAEYALLPVIGPATVALGARVIVRQWSAQARRGVDRAIDDLRRGESYGMSIEGRRSEDGQLQPYRRGAAVIAIRSGATIVPFLSLHARDRMPFGQWQVRPGPIRCVMLDKIRTTDLTLDDRFGLTERLRRLAEDELAARGFPQDDFSP